MIRVIVCGFNTSGKELTGSETVQQRAENGELSLTTALPGRDVRIWNITTR